ncbi:hypothetical protein ACFX16_008736 [Malus domestica]
MTNELADLVGPYRNEALVASVLAVLLLENDAGDAAGLALFGGDALAGRGAWDCEDGLGVLRVGYREGCGGFEVAVEFGVRVEEGGGG